jgi:amino acid permease
MLSLIQSSQATGMTEESETRASMEEALLAPSTDTDTALPDHQPILTITSQAYPEDDEEENDSGEYRVGTIASARFNILSTMVGGGCLSLPLAFQQSGNSLLGPLLLILVGLITDFCFRLLVASAVYLERPHSTRPGKDSFESITQAAFGPKAYIMSQCLVFFMCFFGAVGYSVLLRDMMEPINDAIIQHFATGTSEWFKKNFTMFAVILVVTPATTLQTLTSLKSCGAASMFSIFILGSCIVFRSLQCQINNPSPDPWYSYLTLWPESPRKLLDAVPLYISCFVCHYNIFPVHNELQNPSPLRVSWWLRSTTWYAAGLYLIMGWTGSAYGHCTPSGKVQGNVLLDFDEHDPLLLVGRMCLALTITLAFPMLVIPGRDIVLRSSWMASRASSSEEVPSTLEELQEPLLNGEDDDDDEEAPTEEPQEEEESARVPSASFFVRLLVSIAIFWTAGTVASLVDGIEVVWDLLGSSLSILLSYLIPCGSYLAITKEQPGHKWSKALCWILIGVFTPLMIVSTANAVENTFLSN